MNQENKKLLSISDLSNINAIDSRFLQNILCNYFKQPDCIVESFKRQTLSGGFDAEVTGGGLYLFKLKGKVGNKQACPIVLKAIPSFKDGKGAVMEKLRKLGHSFLANLLKKFPSNEIGKREVMSYHCLPTKIPLRMPALYHSKHNPKTERAWLFLEDLTPYQFFPANNSYWTEKRLKNVLQQMANFHSIFWGKTNKLTNQTWFGRWWNEQKSDYVSLEIAQYLVDACARIHPDILTSIRHGLLNIAIRLRAKLHKEFTHEPQTVIHWDFNPSNICFDKSASKNKRLILFDWQTTSIGLPQWDIAQLLIPCLNTARAKTMNSFIESYIAFLPSSIQSSLNADEFYRLFDLVVLDHFFRVCWPILFSGQKIKNNNPYFLEWQHALNWIENHSAKWLSDY